ncbi:MAG: GntR family transcriptional regulator [Lachnospiraceae bacterium]|nr:GntR family transcriptional regulator [Lachnospiraceae bacterium]
MDIIISNNSSSPIYEQITTQIKEMILNGSLQEGDALPSMRSLAKELRISIITTKRAYEDLERDGFIESFTGRGSFVKAANSEILREELLCQVEELLVEACSKAAMSGQSRQELTETLELLYDRDDKPE